MRQPFLPDAGRPSERLTQLTAARCRSLGKFISRLIPDYTFMNINRWLITD